MGNNNISKKRFRAINFDFSTEKLKALYPNKNYTQAYDDVKRFLTSNGFEHRQGSGYKSVERMTGVQFNEIIDSLFKKYPWMSLSLNKADVSIIEAEFDILKEYEKRKAALEHISDKDFDSIENLVTDRVDSRESDKLMSMFHEVIYTKDGDIALIAPEEEIEI